MDNNSYLTEDTLKYFEKWAKETFNIRIPHLDKIGSDNLKAAITSWKDTNAALSAQINNIPIWMNNLIMAFCQFDKVRKKETGDFNLENQYTEREGIFSFTKRNVVNIKYDTTTPDTLTIVYNSENKAIIKVPEGYDGKNSHIRLLVPDEVITFMHRRQIDFQLTPRYDYSEGWGTAVPLYHPLLRNTLSFVDNATPTAGDQAFYLDDCGAAGYFDYRKRNNGVPGTIIDSIGMFCYSEIDSILDSVNLSTSQKYGNYREHALLFYQRFVKKGVLQLDISKEKEAITLNWKADKFLPPFRDYEAAERTDDNYTLIDPKVLVKVMFFKRGI